ncbi:hypothetical protein ALP75_201643 [Pseudomonas syringae pv. actinidiae]|nr:hypothetical protein A3SO_27718 [Pseudomonas syringae pv. actinidiae ICMP 19072]RMS10591.1 hypothetical protein ALP75_201643 [Pseudomonas syringae pv. actinidiae]
METVIAKVKNILELLGVLTIKTFYLRQKILIHFKCLIVTLPILETTALTITLWGPRNSSAIWI